MLDTVMIHSESPSGSFGDGSLSCLYPHVRFHGATLVNPVLQFSAISVVHATQSLPFLYLRYYFKIEVNRTLLLKCGDLYVQL